MEPKQEKIFTQGFIFKRPREGAPDFVKGAISIKVDEFIDFLSKHQNDGWVNIDLKKSREGKLYTELNTYKKKGSVKSPEEEYVDIKF